MSSEDNPHPMIGVNYSLLKEPRSRYVLWTMDYGLWTIYFLMADYRGYHGYLTYCVIRSMYHVLCPMYHVLCRM